MNHTVPFKPVGEIERLERRIADLEAQVRLLAGTAWQRPAPAPSPIWPPVLQPWPGAFPPGTITAQAAHQKERDDWFKALPAVPLSQTWQRAEAPDAATPIRPGEQSWLTGKGHVGPCWRTAHADCGC